MGKVKEASSGVAEDHSQSDAFRCSSDHVAERVGDSDSCLDGVGLPERRRRNSFPARLPGVSIHPKLGNCWSTRSPSHQLDQLSLT